MAATPQSDRWFIGLRQHQGDWVANLLHFDGKDVHQHNTWSGEQCAACPSVSYYPKHQQLTFTPTGSTLQQFQATEVTAELGTFLTQPDKWSKLQHGLAIKSPKTIVWLRERIAAATVQAATAPAKAFREQEPLAWDRGEFEAWIQRSPYEKVVTRFPNNETEFAWPGQYRDNSVQLAWEAWLEGIASFKKNFRADQA